MFILGAMTVTIAESTVASLSNKSGKMPATKIIIGGYLVTVALLIGSDINAEVAEGFALLIMLASVFGPNGTTLAKLITRVTGGTTPRAKGDLAAAPSRLNNFNGMNMSNLFPTP